MANTYHRVLIKLDGNKKTPIESVGVGIERGRWLGQQPQLLGPLNGFGSPMSIQLAIDALDV